MIIVVCPNCQKKHSVDEKRIPPNEKVKAHCKSCGHRFPIPVLNKKQAVLKQQVKTKEQSSEVKEQYPRTISVSISKGGVGKTTTSVNLSAGLALAGYKVLLIDTDTQGQDSYMLGVSPKAGLTEFLTKELEPQEAIFQARENLWLLSGGKSLAGIKRLIDRKTFGGEMTLAESLQSIENNYDYIIIDTSPGWDPLTVNVLFYVKEILTPVALEVMSLQGLVEFLRSISSIQKYRKETSIKYILPTFLDKRVKHPEEILEKLKELYDSYLCNPIRYSVNLSEAPAYGQTIYEFAPGCTGADDYRELVRKITNNDKALR